MQAMETKRLNQFSLGTQVIESEGKYLTFARVLFHFIFTSFSSYLSLYIPSHHVFLLCPLFPFIHPKNGVYTQI